MRFNICNKFSNGVILRNKKNNMCSGKREKMKRGTRICFGFEVEDRVSGEGLKEVGSKNELTGMERIEFK